MVLSKYSRMNPVEPIVLIRSNPELLIWSHILGAGSVPLPKFLTVGRDPLLGCEVNLEYGDEHFKQIK